jgi:predicted ester cyclase
MPRQENIDALQGAMLRFRVRDLEGYLAIYSPSVIHHGFSSRIRSGLTGLKDHYSALLNGFPDMRVEIDDIIADGEKVAHRFQFSGTHKADYMGIRATGKRISASGVHIQLFQQGKCIEVWQVFDALRFMSQIGAIPKLEKPLALSAKR